jgi:transcriptional regulator with XRE-family HTH domain
MGNSGNDEGKFYMESPGAAPDSCEYRLRLFGDRLKRIMMMRSISCNELAKLIFASPSTITGYRTGRRGPDVAQLTTLARALNVSADYLLGLKDEPEKLFPDESTQNPCDKKHIS